MTKKEQPPLRILSLDVENILRVVAVHIRPDGRVVELTGKNRNGKSSTIDALWMALGGEKMIPPDAIHDGAEMGKVLVEIGDDDGVRYTVTRKIKAKEGGGYSLSLTVENEDGGKMQNPQQILNNLVGALSCDPLEFIGMKPKDQYELLKKFVPGVDFDAMDKAHDDEFKLRTDVNRDLKALEAQIAGIAFDENAPSERIDESALVAELEGAGEHNALIERRRAGRDQAARDIETATQTAAGDRARAAELRAQAEAMDRQAEAQEAHVAELKSKFDLAEPLPAPIDTSAVRVKINEARSANVAFDNQQRLKADADALKQRANALRTKSEALTKSIDDRKSAKAKAITEAKIPVPGIGFGDGAILLDGRPLENASQAQKLQTAIAIAAALQPRLRFITTKNAALLDDDSWAALVEMAEQLDLLVIAETVNSRRPTAVVIEDGHVRGVVSQAAE